MFDDQPIANLGGEVTAQRRPIKDTNVRMPINADPLN
jgi:hypothetical protein